MSPWNLTTQLACGEGCAGNTFPGFNKSCIIVVGLYSLRKTTSVGWSPQERVGCARDRLHLGFARVLRVIYGSQTALCVTQVLPAQMLGLGVDSTEGAGKGDSQLSVGSVSDNKCKAWKSRFWFLALCCNSRSGVTV